MKDVQQTTDTNAQTMMIFHFISFVTQQQHWGRWNSSASLGLPAI